MSTRRNSANAPVELPTRLGSNEAGSVLFLEPEAEAALGQFR